MQKHKTTMSGSQFQRAKEDAAAIMREKQRLGMSSPLAPATLTLTLSLALSPGALLTCLVYSRRATRGRSGEKEIASQRPFVSNSKFANLYPRLYFPHASIVLYQWRDVDLE